MAWLRRAGRATLPDGQILIWSVAEGRRGRRWRASTRSAAGGLLDDLLLEVEPGGRLARLELTTSAGQLTFHPAPDERSAHGNFVEVDGVRHLAVAWAPGRRVDLPWSPIADAVLVASLDGARARVLAVATIGRDLVPRSRSVSVTADGAGRWRLDGRSIVVDQEGLPVIAGGSVWPLEDPAVQPE